MDQGLAAVLGAAVGVFGTALASYVTGRHQAKTQHEQWQRQSRRDTYASFVTAIENADDSALETKRLLAGGRAAPAVAKLDELEGHVHAAARLATVIKLEGPQGVAHAADRLILALEMWHGALKDWHAATEAGAGTRSARDHAHSAEALSKRYGLEFMAKAQAALARAVAA